MDFDPVLLRAFVAVTKAGGFTRAAQRLHLTQSAVSHQIRRLEEQAGRPLLCRTTRNLNLTEDGIDFLQYAERILSSLDALTQRFLTSPVSGVVRFGVPETFMGERLLSLLSQFAREFPAVRLDVSVNCYDDLRAMVDADELDLAVVASTSDRTNETILRQDRFLWAAAETFEIPPNASLPMVFSPEPCVNRRVGVAALGSGSIEWHVVFTSPSRQGIRAAVRAGLGVSVLTGDELEPGMKIVDGKYGLPPLPKAYFMLIWSIRGKTPAALEFGKLIVSLSKSPVHEPQTASKVFGAGKRRNAGPSRTRRM
jgi:DNA-binding transcriptional LysR family regulator